MIVEFCPKVFFCIFGDDHMVFMLKLFNMIYHIDWFPYIEEFLHSSEISHLIMMYSPFNVLLDLINEYFVETLFKIWQLEYRVQCKREFSGGRLVLFPVLELTYNCDDSFRFHADALYQMSNAPFPYLGASFLFTNINRTTVTSKHLLKLSCYSSPLFY